MNASHTILMAVGDNPSALWFKGVGSCVSICHPLAHGFRFCGALMLAIGAS
jgi:hypothetical protein